MMYYTYQVIFTLKQNPHNFFMQLRFSDSLLANILAVKQDLCRKPFDLKIDDVRFVGYPMSLDPNKSKPGAHQIISFNITFVLRVCNVF